MAIIVVLAGMSLVQHQNSVQRAQEAVLKEDLFRMRDAIDQYYADRNKYPATLPGPRQRQGPLRAPPDPPFTQLQTTPGRRRPPSPTRAILAATLGFTT